MTLRERTTVVIVPGLRGQVEEHWQSWLAAKLPNPRVVTSFGRDKRDLRGRVADLQEVVAEAGSPVTIVAHSAGVLTTVHWAQRHDLHIDGALLAFTSIVAASSNDALGDRERVRELATAWGSRLVDLGPVGHLNPASGYGDWPDAERFLDQLGGMAVDEEGRR